MYDIKSWGTTITAFFNYLGSLSWPIVVIIVVCIFREPLAKLIANLKSLKWKDFILEFGDRVPVFSPTDKKFHYVELQEPPTTKAAKIKVSRLSEDEIKQSEQRARERLEEDTKRVGYKRGRLFQLDNGKWAIAWEVEASATIGLKDTFGTTT